MNSSASQLLPPIHIPQAPLPLCSHPYSDPTRLVLRGASASLLSSLLRPNQARVAWGRQAPGRAASASEEWSRLQGGRLQLIQERDPVTTTNVNQPTNRKWIVTLIWQ